MEKAAISGLLDIWFSIMCMTIYPFIDVEITLSSLARATTSSKFAFASCDKYHLSTTTHLYKFQENENSKNTFILLGIQKCKKLILPSFLILNLKNIHQGSEQSNLQN